MFDIWAQPSTRANAQTSETRRGGNVDLMSHRDARHRTAQRNRLRCAHRKQRQRNMKDRKKVPEDSEETQKLEQSFDVASEDDPKRVRTLTVQDLERLLKNKKLAP